MSFYCNILFFFCTSFLVSSKAATVFLWSLLSRYIILLLCRCFCQQTLIFVCLFIDEPDVQAEKAWIHADVGVEIEISCTVYAEPSAEVSFWFSMHISEYQKYTY